MHDSSENLIEQVKEAHDKNVALKIVGGNSKKNMIARDFEAQELDVAEHRGLVSYEPSELVMTVRSGTRLSDIAVVLDAENQMLSFEPPHFGETATIGGTLACNLSGPSRPWTGSVRDMTLGVRLINGKGEHLRFGGEVMKNVAGYDGSRLQAGALGSLGVITEVSLKVLPKPEASMTIVQEHAPQSAITLMNELSGQPKPLTGAVWVDDKLYLRLAGSEKAVKAAAEKWGGAIVAHADTFWEGIREQRHDFFQNDKPLWRLSVRANAAHIPFEENQMIDWGGAQRWVFSDKPLSEMETVAAKAGGHAALFKGGERTGEVRQSLDAVQRKLQSRIKEAFDPKNIINPGCLYGWM